MTFPPLERHLEAHLDVDHPVFCGYLYFQSPSVGYHTAFLEINDLTQEQADHLEGVIKADLLVAMRHNTQKPLDDEAVKTSLVDKPEGWMLQAMIVTSTFEGAQHVVSFLNNYCGNEPDEGEGVPLGETVN